MSKLLEALMVLFLGQRKCTCASCGTQFPGDTAGAVEVGGDRVWCWDCNAADLVPED